MSEEIITKDIAEQFIDREEDDCVDLSCFTKLSDAAAESLSKCKGILSLSLSRLTELSDAAVEQVDLIEEVDCVHS